MNPDTPTTIHLRRFIVDLPVETKARLADFLSFHCHLPATRIKDALAKGAVQVKKRNTGRRRIRKASFQLYRGDCVRFGYNPAVLAMAPPPLLLHHGAERFSIWLKPAGMLSQGTDYGDHCSLVRQADIHYSHHKKNFVVHRLDREVSGLVLTAHDRKAAGLYSSLFKENRVDKKYVGRVHGCLGRKDETMVFDRKIEGKTALTSVRIIESTPEWTTLDISIRTGRKHQIRRHLSLAGFPLIGDRRYGKKEKNEPSIALIARALSFRCPFSDEMQVFELPQEYLDAF